MLKALANVSIDLSGQSIEAGLLKAMASNEIHERLAKPFAVRQPWMMLVESLIP